MFIIVCLGRYFLTPEVGVVPETLKDYDFAIVSQSSTCNNAFINIYTCRYKY